jgi:CheY-like chemotaxis protein
MHLPYASGVDVLRELRSNERWAKIPVIVSTADLMLAKSVEGQAEHVLIKPVSVGRLFEIVTQVRDAIAPAD